jgi:hypothetical protein
MRTVARLSIGEYDRMIESGVFENRRLELIYVCFNAARAPTRCLQPATQLQLR